MVRQPRKLVVGAEVIDSFLSADVVDCKRDVAGQAGQEFHLFFVKEILFPGIQGKYADGFSRHNQRKDRERAHSRLGVVLSERSS